VKALTGVYNLPGATVLAIEWAEGGPLGGVEPGRGGWDDVGWPSLVAEPRAFGTCRGSRGASSDTDREGGFLCWR
jgi:hypothetical protein